MQTLARVEVGKRFKTATHGVTANRREYKSGEVFTVVKAYASSPWYRVCTKVSSGEKDGIWTFAPYLIVLSPYESQPTPRELERGRSPYVWQKPLRRVVLMWDGKTPIERLPKAVTWCYLKLLETGRTSFTRDELAEVLDPLDHLVKGPISIRRLSSQFVALLPRMERSGYVTVER